MLRLAVVPLAALLIAGCGAQSSGGSASDFQGEERAVADAVEGLRTAAQEADGAKLCRDVLSQELVRRFEQAGGAQCAQAVEEAVRDADTFDLTVEDVTVQGRRATAKVQARAGQTTQTDTLTLVRERGRWRVSALQAQA